MYNLTHLFTEPYINTCIKCGTVFESVGGYENFCEKCGEEMTDSDRSYNVVKERFRQREVSKWVKTVRERSIEEIAALAQAEGVSYGVMQGKLREEE